MYILSPKRLVAPFFSRFQRWVCRASQVMMDDGTSVEDAVSEIAQSGGSGSGGDGMLKLSLYGLGVETSEDGVYEFDIILDEQATSSATNFVLYSQVEAIFAAPEGTIIAIVASNNPGSDPKVTALGIKQNGANPNVCVIPCSFGVQEIALSKKRMSCLVTFANSGGGGGEK